MWESVTQRSVLYIPQIIFLQILFLQLRRPEALNMFGVIGNCSGIGAKPRADQYRFVDVVDDA
jgi:hypothetical protein